MASSTERRRGRGPEPLVVLGALVGELVLLGARPPAAHGRESEQVVTAVASAYRTGGTLAVAVAKQQRPIAGQPLRGYEGRRIRAGAGLADNGPLAAQP